MQCVLEGTKSDAASSDSSQIYFLSTGSHGVGNTPEKKCSASTRYQ